MNYSSRSCGVWLLVNVPCFTCLSCKLIRSTAACNGCVHQSVFVFRLTINRLPITHFKSEIGAYQPDLTGNRLSYIVRRPFPQRTVYFWLFLTEVARFPSWAHEVMFTYTVFELPNFQTADAHSKKRFGRM